MIFIKFSWMPYLLILGGIYGIIAEPDAGYGVVCLIIGGIWAYIRHKKQ